MIYHILNDEKFTDWVIESFNKFEVSDKQKFILVSSKKYSNYFCDKSVKIISKEYYINDFKPNNNDLLIFYFLHLHTISFLLKIKHIKCKKIWIGYGADYYYYLLNPRSFHSFYLKKTQKYFNFINRHHFFKRMVLALYQQLFLYIKVLPALKTLTHFAPILPNEFSIIRNKFPFLNFKYLEFTFGDISFLGSTQKEICGTSILLGNSATFTCNHIDVLDILDKLKISNSIIIPLSYGNLKYKEFLNENICKDFSNLNIELLNDFLPLKRYNQVLAKCAFAIMPQLRQQGMGNIYSLLYSGTKLFLFKENPVYEFLNKLGVCFYSIEELITNPQLIAIPLGSVEVENNRRIINNYYSKEKSLDRVAKIIIL
ncbi:hypothetical protein GCM10027284_25280 [Cyclobacterium sediminis]